MNLSTPIPPPGDDRELRLTALLLGELTEAEAAVLRAETAADADLRKLHEELARTIGLVREAGAMSTDKAGPTAEPLKLSDERREKLLAAFKTVQLPVASKKPRIAIPWRETGAVAAMLAMLAGVAVLLIRTSVLPEDRLAESMDFLFAGLSKKKPDGVTALPTLTGSLDGRSDISASAHGSSQSERPATKGVAAASEDFGRATSARSPIEKEERRRGQKTDSWAFTPAAGEEIKLDSNSLSDQEGAQSREGRASKAPARPSIYLGSAKDGLADVGLADKPTETGRPAVALNYFRADPSSASEELAVKGYKRSYGTVLRPVPPVSSSSERGAISDGSGVVEFSVSSGKPMEVPVRSLSTLAPQDGQVLSRRGEPAISASAAAPMLGDVPAVGRFFRSSGGAVSTGSAASTDSGAVMQGGGRGGGFGGGFGGMGGGGGGRQNLALDRGLAASTPAAPLPSPAPPPPPAPSPQGQPLGWFESKPADGDKVAGARLRSVDRNESLGLGGFGTESGIPPAKPDQSKLSAGVRGFYDDAVAAAPAPLTVVAPSLYAESRRAGAAAFNRSDSTGKTIELQDSLSVAAFDKPDSAPIAAPVPGTYAYFAEVNGPASGPEGMAQEPALRQKSAELPALGQKAQASFGEAGNESLAFIPANERLFAGSDLRDTIDQSRNGRADGKTAWDAAKPELEAKQEMLAKGLSEKTAKSEVRFSLAPASKDVRDFDVAEPLPEERAKLNEGLKPVGDPAWIGALGGRAGADKKEPDVKRLSELSQQTAVAASKLRGLAIALPQLTEQNLGEIVVARKRVDATAVAIEELKSLPESVAARGRQLAENKPAPVRALGRSGADTESQKEVDRLGRLQAALSQRVEQEMLDSDLSAKNSGVKVIDQAKVESAPKQSLFGRTLDGLTGSSRRSATVAVDKDRTDIQGLSNGRATGYDPYFLATEQEAITSPDVLARAIRSRALADVPGISDGGIESGISRLKSKISVSKNAKSSLLEISATDSSPEVAAKLANAVADAYREKHQEDNLKTRVQGVAELRRHLDQVNQQLSLAKPQAATPVEAAREIDAPATRKPAPNAAVPQPEVATVENAFSTFSLNVSDVSFKLAAASLEKSVMPDPATVRSEEFINAFDYRDPEPAPGVPIAFASERARYPFAHDRDLVRFSVKTAAAGRQPGKPYNLVLAIDNSGSMERADRVRILQECIRTLGSQLLPEDRISVVSFARTARLWVDGVPVAEAGDLAQRIGRLTPEGGTNLEEAMNVAYKTALRHFVPGGVNRVVLITDGAANLGDVEPDSLKQKVEAHRKQGVALDCFGIGWDGFNDDLLEVLSRNGDGRYGFINTPEAAATEFAGQLAGALKVAASDVKVQVEWNPRRVTSYRQIGYAKHQLKKEQFRDNTVDAAEIGAAEAGNALYTVQVNPAGEGPLATVRVRFRVPNTSDYREHEWIVPYATPAPGLDQASPTLRLAATASAFSEWLVASPFAAEVTPSKLLGYLRGVPQLTPADPRPKQLETMIQQARTLSGQ